MRFGICMNTDHTLEEIGQQFSVTRERIRQIEAKALRKLKHPEPEEAVFPGSITPWTPVCRGRSRVNPCCVYELDPQPAERG